MSWPKKLCVICHQELACEWVNSRVCDRPTCQQTYRQHLDRGGRLCAVCGQLVHPRMCFTSRFSICNRLECLCQMNALTQPTAAFCEFCGIHLPVSSGSREVCNDQYCRTRLEVRLAKQRAEQQIARQQQFDEQLLQTWVDSKSAYATIGDELTLEQLPLPVALPSYLGKLEASQARIPDLRQHLFALAAEACSQLAPERLLVQAGLDATEDQHASTGDNESREDPSESRVDEIALAACSLCRGRCCTKGGNRAYLTANTLTNFAKERGITNVEQLVEEYVGRVPPRTFQDSCIFHGETGCGLPRAMRSSTCNSYLCVSAQHVRDQFLVAQQSHRGLLLGSTNMDNEGEAAVKVYSLSLVQPMAPSSV